MQSENVKEQTKNVQKQGGLNNSKQKDSSGKIIFGDPILCSQFLRGYTQIELLNNVQPEDIEDVTERFVHMFTEERNSDVIKKVHLKNRDMPFYLISLIEHKSTIDYNVAMQILRYMVFIWEDYEKDKEREQKGVSKTKGFRYPPILPIIYYTGRENWTAAVTLDERICLSNILEEYIPNFKCILVQVKDYSNAQLMEKRDELSIIMMINKMQQTSDFVKWKEDVGTEYLKDTTQGTPEYLLGIMAQMIEILLENINVPKEEAENVAENIKERNMAGLFDHFEKIDIQAARREIEQEKEAARIEGREEGREEGRAEGRAEGRTEGRKEGWFAMIELCRDLGVSKEETKKKLLQAFPECEQDVNDYIDQILSQND